MRKKEILATILDRLLPDSILPAISSICTQKLTVLAYHRIADIDKASYQFDDELISASINDFEFQVKYINKHYNPISMEQLINHINDRAELPTRPLLITFDDGFDDNFHAAFPILKKHNVPATIFISTGFIEAIDTIWFDQLTALILAMNEQSIYLDELNKTYQLKNDKRSRYGAVAEILYDIKRIPDKDRLALITRLNDEFSLLKNKINYQQSKMLTWDQIREMNKSVISFGSHTVNHPILTRLDEKSLNAELLESKSTIELELNTEILSISYPDGNSEAFSSHIIERVKDAKYDVGFSYIAGINPIPLKNHFSIKRLHIEYYMSRSHFKALLSLPRIFCEH